MKNEIKSPDPIYKFDPQTRIDFPLFSAVLAGVAILGGIYSLSRIICRWCIEYEGSINQVRNISNELSTFKTEQAKEFVLIKDSIGDIRTELKLLENASELLEKQFQQTQVFLTEKNLILQSHEIDRVRAETIINHINQKLNQLEIDIEAIKSNCKK